MVQIKTVQTRKISTKKPFQDLSHLWSLWTELHKTSQGRSLWTQTTRKFVNMGTSKSTKLAFGWPQCSQSLISAISWQTNNNPNETSMPSKPLSLENGTVEDANFTLEVIDLKDVNDKNFGEGMENV